MDHKIIPFPNQSNPHEPNINALISDDFTKGIINLTTNNELVSQMPMIQLIRYFLRQILAQGEVKLTKIGNLPPTMVKDLYAQKIILDDAIEHGITKLSKESDCISIVLMRSLCELSGLMKVRNNTISLTKKGLGLFETGEIFPLIFQTMCFKFNWGYFDGFENPHTGQQGCNLSFFLLSQYGDQFLSINFYAEKYFAIFPELMTETRFRDEITASTHCYVLRTFERFLGYFGFVELTGRRLEERFIKKTLLFDNCIKINF